MFDRLSIRYKLVVLLGLSAAIGLLASSLITIFSSFAAEKEGALRSLQQIAGITSENMRAALAFHDAQSAHSLLKPLASSPNILYAFVAAENGNLLAEYRAADLPDEAPAAFLQGFQFDRERSQGDWRRAGQLQQMAAAQHRVLQRIDFEGQPIGMLGIVSDNQAMYARIYRFMALQGLTSLLLLMALLLLSLRLQNLFTQPIYALIEFMKGVARSKDYRTSYNCLRQDEFCKLADGLNAMLGEIRSRDEQLHQLASTDALTGLANRRRAEEVLEGMALRAQRSGEPVGVILLDIDHFKQINDSYGHPAGDRVLRQLADTLARHARPYDLVARIGGEEFLMLCDGSDRASTLAIAERLRQQVAGQDFAINEQQSIRLTISLGVHAAVPLPGMAMLALEPADQALYQAKRAGRNQAIVWPEH